MNGFKLNNMIYDKAKTYCVMPVKAMKYVKGLESGYIVHYNAVYNNVLYEGLKVFENETAAYAYVKADARQRIRLDNVEIELNVTYHDPQPVIHRMLCPEEHNSLNEVFEHAFMSDESEKYELLYLYDFTWLVQDSAGNVRTWDRSCIAFNESLFGDITSVCEINLVHVQL